MRVQSAKIVASVHKHSADKSAAPASFAGVLAANTSSNSGAAPAREMLPLGVISAQQPTVSDILINNEQFRHDTWSIISSDKNAVKDYAGMPPGTKVYIDKNTLELHWTAGACSTATRPADSAGQAATPQTVSPVTAAAGAPPAVLPAISTEKEQGGAGAAKISLGRLDRENSTVSHLLLQNPRYARDAWRIIQADSNRDKAFTQIRKGDEIFLDPRTMELSWRQAAPLQATAGPAQSAAAEESVSVPVPAAEELAAAGQVQSDPLSSGLVQAVQTYLGRSYREINCYGLVVRGLSRMGIKYGGRGGLQNQLVQMARSKGLPENAYMTGEGLIEVSGSKVFGKVVNPAGNVDKTADRIFDEMTPYLQKGYILSFSTPTRGHTGVISRHERTWTFINSGHLDNQVNKIRSSKGVGEEDLASEIRNWCRVAARRGESLQITLGRLQEEKLRTARREDTPSLQKVL